MVKRSDKKPSSENYSFIKETIKEHPTDKKSPVKKFLTAAVCGVILAAVRLELWHYFCRE